VSTRKADWVVPAIVVLLLMSARDLHPQQTWTALASTMPNNVLHCAANPQDTSFSGGTNVPTMVVVPFSGNLYSVGTMVNDCPVPAATPSQSTPVLSVSTDGGKSWGASSLKGSVGAGSPTNVPVNAFATDQQMFIVYNYGGISASSDGTHWGPLVPSNCNSSSLTVIPKGSALLLQCGENLLISPDAGTTWKTPSPAGKEFTICAYGDEAILCASRVAQSNGVSGPGFFRSVDLGATWEQCIIPLVRPDITSQYITRLLGTANALIIQLYTAMSPGPLNPYSGTQFLYSLDAGHSWRFQSLPFVSDIIASPLDSRMWVLPSSTGTVYFGLFVSSDEGQSWTDLTTGLPDPHSGFQPFAHDGWLALVYPTSPSASQTLWTLPLGNQQVLHPLAK
jgi:hypothetical protein